MTWPSIPDARPMRTRIVMEFHAHLQRTIDRRGISVFVAPSGFGKTTAARLTAANHKPSLPLLTVPDPRTGGLLRQLHTAAGIPYSTDRLAHLRRDFLEELNRPLLLILDAADRLTLENARLLAHLVAESEGRLSLALLTRRAFEKRTRQAHEFRAIAHWTPSPRLNQQDILELMPAYHAVWSDASESVLLRIDKTIRSRSFGEWAFATEAAIALRPPGAGGIRPPWTGTLVNELLANRRKTAP